MSQHVYLGFSYSDPFGTDLGHSIQAFLTLPMVKNCKVHQLMRHPGQSQVVSQKMAETLQTLPLLCMEFHENYKDNILNVVLKLSQKNHVISIIKRFALYLENTKQTQGQHSIYYLCSFHGTTCIKGGILSARPLEQA